MAARRTCGQSPPDRCRSWLLLVNGLLLLCISVVSGQGLDCSPGSSCFTQQGTALGHFYEALGGSSWRSNTNWLSTSVAGQHCSWAGIYCCLCPALGASGTFLPASCSTPCSVIGIDLPNNNLAGAFGGVDATAVWQQLMTLQFLDIQGMTA